MYYMQLLVNYQYLKTCLIWLTYVNQIDCVSKRYSRFLSRIEEKEMILDNKQKELER